MWQWVARVASNKLDIQQMEPAFAHAVHAAPSVRCNYCMCVCACVNVCVCVTTISALKTVSISAV